MLNHLYCMNPKHHIYGAWILVSGLAIIGWPVSQLTVARSEPPFILALSWLAMIQAANRHIEHAGCER